MAQANNSFFIRPRTADTARRLLREGKIHFLGSDCHNCDDRPQNSAAAAELFEGEDRSSYEELNKNADLSIFSVDNRQPKR